MVTSNAESGPSDCVDVSKAIRVVIVDDHPLIRTGLQRIIDQSDTFVVCAEAGDAAAGISVIRKHKPEIAIVDVSLPDGDGIGLTKRLLKRFRRLAVLVLSMHDESEYALRAIDAGAMGYMVKHEAAEKIEMALRQVLNGRPYLSPSVAGEIGFDAILRRRHRLSLPLGRSAVQARHRSSRSRKAPKSKSAKS